MIRGTVILMLIGKLDYINNQKLFNIIKFNWVDLYIKILKIENDIAL